MSDTQLATTENKKKEIQAFIDTVVMDTPSLKDRLTVAVAWNYLQMPDKSFGWTTAEKMPQQNKLMCIAAHLQAGAKIGYGHIYFLGNKLYQSADFVRSKAASDPEWKMCGDAKFIPHTPDEKAMFGLGEKDLSCKCLIEVEYKGKVFTAQGDGIIGADELSGNKVGFSTVKNRAMTLKTRAMRDLYSRFYPTHGVPVAPDDSEEQQMREQTFTQQVQVVKENQTEESRAEVRSNIIEAQEVKADDAIAKQKKKQQLEILEKIKENAKIKGIQLKKLWELAACKTQAEFLELENIADALETMSDYVDGFTDTPPAQEQAKPEIISNHEQAAGEILLNNIKKKYKSLVEQVEAKGGLPMRILGYNHLNVFEFDTMKKVNEAMAVLQKYLDEKPQPQPEVEADFFDLPDEPVAAKPAVEQDKESLKFVEGLLVHERLSDAGTKERLVKLKSCALKKGDKDLIRDYARIGQMKQDYSKLDELIALR
jgi:hypothetical protein